MYYFLSKVILYSFLIVLNKVLRGLRILTNLVIVSYKPVSYIKTCIVETIFIVLFHSCLVYDEIKHQQRF